MDNVQLADSLTFIGQMEAGFNKAMEDGRFLDASTYAETLGKEWEKVFTLLKTERNQA